MAPDPKHVGNVGGILSKLLGETLIHHAPWTSEVSEATRERFKNAWLEGLESHTTGMISDLMDRLMADGQPPAEVASILEHVKDPSAQFGSLVQQFFVYGLMFQLAGTMLAPFTQDVQNNVWAAHPDRPIPPADIATAVVRGIGLGDSAGVDVPGWALTEAAKSGFDSDVMNTLVGVTGDAPALELLFQMIRRSIIDESQLTEGIKEGDIKDKWIPFVEKLRYVQPSPIDIINAYLRAQISESDARAWAAQLGLEPAGYVDGNPDWFQIMYDTAGRPPGVIELLELAKRGFIPFDGTGPAVLSVEQAVDESDIKPKWYPAIKDLARYYPPNGEIRGLLQHGWITDAQARALWAANGVDETLQGAYAAMAETEQTTQDRALAKGDIESLILERVITDDQAKDLLQRIGYTGDNADYIVSMANFRFEMEALREAIRQVGSLYTKRKITASEAKTGLEALGLPEANVSSLLDILTAQRNSQVLLPTVGQVTTAAFYDIIDTPTALLYLQQLGYAEWDAWLVLSARLHAPAGPEPPAPGQITNPS